MPATRLVVFGTSNFLSDIFDAAIALGLVPSRVVLHLAEHCGERDVPLSERIAALAARGIVVTVETLQSFEPGADEVYFVGPTTPARRVLVDDVTQRFPVEFCSLVHPAACVSPFASVGNGVFVGAHAVLAPGVRCDDFSLVNRGATVGHDTHLGRFARIQPGATVCGLASVGTAVTVGAGATVVERVRIGERAYVAAGAVVVDDVAASTLVAGVPARVIRVLTDP